MPQLTRRDFLKLARKGVETTVIFGNPLLRRSAQGLENLGQYKNKPIRFEVSPSSRNVLTPRQITDDVGVILGQIHPDDIVYPYAHDSTDSNLYELRNYDELWQHVTYWGPQLPLVMRAIYDPEMKDHLTALKLAHSKGINLVATDIMHPLKYDSQTSRIVGQILDLSGAAYSDEALKIKGQSGHLEQRDEFMQDPFFAAIRKNYGSVRSAQMVYNTRTFEMMLDQNIDLRYRLGVLGQNSREIIFSAGSGYQSAEYFYNNLTMEQLEAYLGNSIRRDINLGIRMAQAQDRGEVFSPMLVAVETEKQKKMQDPKPNPGLLLDAWKFLAHYSFLIGEHERLEDHQRFSNYQLPPSPRLMLWNELLERYQWDGKHRAELGQLISTLAESDVLQFAAERWHNGINHTKRYRGEITPLMLEEMQKKRADGEVEEINLTKAVPEVGPSPNGDLLLIKSNQTPFIVRESQVK